MLWLFLCFSHPGNDSGNFGKRNSLEPRLPHLLDPRKLQQLRAGIHWAILCFLSNKKGLSFPAEPHQAHIRKWAFARLKSQHRALFKFVGLFNVHHTFDPNSASDFLSEHFFSTSTRKTAPPNISTACYFEAVRQNITAHRPHLACLADVYRSLDVNFNIKAIIFLALPY